MLLKAVEVLLVGVQQPTTTKSPTTTETTTTLTNPNNSAMSSTSFVSNSNSTEGITSSVRLKFGDDIVFISLTENPIQVLVARDSLVVDDQGEEMEEGEIVEGDSNGEMPTLEDGIEWPAGGRGHQKWREDLTDEERAESDAQWELAAAKWKASQLTPPEQLSDAKLLDAIVRLWGDLESREWDYKDVQITVRDVERVMQLTYNSVHNNSEVCVVSSIGLSPTDASSVLASSAWPRGALREGGLVP